MVLGLINLAGQEGSLFKKTLICRTGVWKGMYGPVEVTRERLQRIADKYNRERATPLNANDYAPILIDHQRSVELVKGRVLADLTVEDTPDPDTGTVGAGLFGTLRVDVADAVQKVTGGQYAQVSLSFDEEDDTLWEVSFVAVEAARRSQALEQGDHVMSVELQAQLKAANESHTALQARVRESVSVRKASHLAMGENNTAALAAVTEIHTVLSAYLSGQKTALLKAQFRGLLRTGQVTKAEFDKFDFPKHSAMSADAIASILGSYRDRPASPHVIQFGQEGAQPVKGKPTPAQIREAIELQKSGKSVKLAAEEPTGDGKQGDKGKEKQTEAAADGEDMDDFSAALKKLGEIEPIVSKSRDFLGKVSESLKKLGEQNEKDAV